jgi:hypothetical protein
LLGCDLLPKVLAQSRPHHTTLCLPQSLGCVPSPKRRVEEASAVCARGYHFSLISTNASIFHSPSSLPIQPCEDLPDCPEVIRRVSGRGESGGSAHVVPIRAGGDHLSPFFGFVAEAVA